MWKEEESRSKFTGIIVEGSEDFCPEHEGCHLTTLKAIWERNGMREKDGSGNI